jgi:hypothetical protein
MAGGQQGSGDFATHLPGNAHHCVHELLSCEKTTTVAMGRIFRAMARFSDSINVIAHVIRNHQ